MIFFLLPAYNEAESIAFTLQGIHNQMQKITKKKYQIIVCNNNSTDGTEKISVENNAVVVTEKIPGYGYTLMNGILYIQKTSTKILDEEKILIFMDADGQDSPENIAVHLKNLEKADFSIASRIDQNLKKGDHKGTPLQNNTDAATWLHTIANKFFGFLLYIRTGKKFSDLGPFRALTMKTFLSLDMKEYTYGWTAEMQKKIAQKNISYTEFFSPPKKRFAGTSKVSGSAVWRQVRIGLQIIWVIVK